jgi:hypothetical protein
MYSSVIYHLLRGDVPPEKYYVVPLLPFVLFSRLLHIDPLLLLIIVDIFLRIFLIIMLFYIYLRPLRNADLKTIILATFVYIGILGLNLPSFITQTFFGHLAVTQFSYYKIFTDFNSPETYKLASIALFLLAILILDVNLWHDALKIMILCLIITFFYPALGLLSLLSYSLAQLSDEQLTPKMRAIFFIRNIFIVILIAVLILGIQSFFVKSFDVSTYFTFTKLFRFFYILPVFLIFFAIIMIKRNSITFFVYNIERVGERACTIIYSRKFILVVKALSLIFAILSLIIYDSKIWTDYDIKIQYLSAYIIATFPIALVSLSNLSDSPNNLCSKSTRGKQPIDLRKKFIILLLFIAFAYYLFSLIYLPDILYFLKGAIILNIFFLVHVFYSVMLIFQKKHFNALNIILLLLFTSLSLIGFYEHLKIWSQIDVSNIIGSTQSIFDTTHQQIESLKTMIEGKKVLLVASDYYTYNLLLLHGFPNLIHPQTISIKDLPKDSLNEIYYIQIKDRKGIVANIYENIPHNTNHTIFIVRGTAFDNKTFISEVTYAASYANGNLQRFSNYPVIHFLKIYDVKKISNDIFIIVGDPAIIDHNFSISKFIMNDPLYYLLIFILLILIFIDILDMIILD